MTQRLSFSKKRIEDLPPADPKKRDYYYDTQVNGLVCAVTSSGTKSFQVYRKLQGKPIRVTLGRFPDMTIEQARRRAQAELSKLAEGINPINEKRAHRALAITLGEVYDDYIKHRDLKPRTRRDYDIVMTKYLADWQTKPVVQITKDLIERRHQKLGLNSHARANMAMRVLRAVLNYAAAKYDDLDGNPIIGFNPVSRLSVMRSWYRVDRRQTKLRMHQLPAWFEAVLSLNEIDHTYKATVVRDWLLFILFTGLRHEESTILRWADVDLKNRSFTIPDPKNRQPHELPLSDFLQELLERRHEANTKRSIYVFPGDRYRDYLVEPRHWIRQIVADSGVKFTPHDLRRTFVSVAESLDFSPYALKRLLNHKINKADVTDGYIVADLERLRRPMQQITDYILSAAEIKPAGEVIPIDKAKQS